MWVLVSSLPLQQSWPKTSIQVLFRTHAWFHSAKTGAASVADHEIQMTAVSFPLFIAF